MLPRPTTSSILASSGSGRKTGISLALNGHGHSSSNGITIRERLSARSRVTNLGILLLLGLSCISTLLNFRFLLVNHRLKHSPLPPSGFGLWETFHGFTPKMLKDNLPDPSPGTDKLTHLVMVAGHAIWAGCNFRDREKDENWVLEDYQRGGSVKTFWKHIQKGVEIADADPSALLIFSGGQTRPTSLQTEAESYFSLALSSSLALPVLPGFNFSPKNDTHAAEIQVKSNKLSANSDEIMGRHKVGSGAEANAGVAIAKGLQGVRMTTENFAMDSFENLLFSVARFREFTGRYPLRITVVGYGMKKSRFEELHAKAIRWPVKGYHGGHRRFHYFGIDDEGDNKSQYEGEKIKGYRLFERDMYGCHGLLQEKRKTRNPTRRFHSYFNGAPELADILNWCPRDDVGLQGVYPLTLPWDLRITTDGWGRGAKQYREQHKGDLLPDHRWLEVHADRG